VQAQFSPLLFFGILVICDQSHRLTLIDVIGTSGIVTVLGLPVGDMVAAVEAEALDLCRRRRGLGTSGERCREFLPRTIPWRNVQAQWETLKPQQPPTCNHMDGGNSLAFVPPEQGIICYKLTYKNFKLWVRFPCTQEQGPAAGPAVPGPLPVGPWAAGLALPGGVVGAVGHRRG
jgi:hypothetical protein